jgi:hypothetical protein
MTVHHNSANSPASFLVEGFYGEPIPAYATSASITLSLIRSPGL